MTGSLLLKCVATGENLDSISASLQINAFILPFREFTDNPQKILDVLRVHKGWRLVHFNDSGLVYLRREEPLVEPIRDMEYTFIDPENRNGNFCMFKSPDEMIIQACIKEGEIAHLTTPDSWRAATILGYFLIQTKAYEKGARLFDNVLYRKKAPKACRINHAICLLYSGRKNEAKAVISQVLDKWPENKLAQNIQRQCEAN